MAEHGLDGANVGAVEKEVGGEAMADDVRSDFFGNAGFDCPLFYHSFHRAGSEAGNGLET